MRTRTGSIDMTAEGRYRVRQTLPVLGRVTTGIYDTEDEAEQQRVAQRAIVSAEVPDDGVTLFTWGERWLTARDVGRLVSDPGSDWSRWNNHVKGDPLARMTLRAIRRRHVRAWLHRVDAKVARQTTLNCLNIVRGMLGAALEDELIKENPAAGMKLPREKRTEEIWTYATPEEQYRLIVCADEPERWIIAFAIGTGLRAGELVSLRLADLHVKGANPRVVVRYGGPPDAPTKGGKIRTVDLFGVGLRAAELWLEALPKFAPKNPRELVFPRARGGFRDELHVLRWSTWTDIREAAGVTDRRFRWHDLRHTCASSLVSGWWGRVWSLHEVRDLLGHESVTTTERYAHIAGTALSRAAAETRSAAGSIGLNWPRRAAARSENPEGSRIAPPVGIGPTTFGLGSPRDLSVTTHEMQADGRLVAASEAYLRAVARGDGDSAAALAAQVGAIYVSDTTRAIELASSVLDRAQRLARPA